MCKNKKLYNLALATTLTTAVVVAIAPTNAAAATVNFKDLPKTDVHYENVMDLADRGIIKGYPDGTFKPYQPIKRAHAAKIIAQALESKGILDTKNVTNPGFKDVPKTHPYYSEIAALANAGIINGYPDGTFGPEITLSRGQLSKIIARAYKLTSEAYNHPFKDISSSEFKKYITMLYKYGVTTGTTKTTYSPGAPVTRGQLATFVVRAENAYENRNYAAELKEEIENLTKDPAFAKVASVVGNSEGLVGNKLTIKASSINLNKSLNSLGDDLSKQLGKLIMDYNDAEDLLHLYDLTNSITFEANGQSYVVDAADTDLLTELSEKFGEFIKQLGNDGNTTLGDFLSRQGDSITIKVTVTFDNGNSASYNVVLEK